MIYYSGGMRRRIKTEASTYKELSHETTDIGALTMKRGGRG